MTQSIVNNVEDNKDTAFDIMLKSVSKTSFKEQKENNFTNIMSNLNAKKEKTQSDFVDRAVKSNTSSINKKALDATAKNGSKDKINLKNSNKNALFKTANNTTAKAKTSKNIEANEQNTSKIQNNNNPLQNETTVKDTIKKELKNDTEIQNSINENQEDSIEVSDLNIDSFVQPSPDFFGNENETQPVENTIKENQVLDLIGAALDINMQQNQSGNEKINAIVNEIISNEDSLKIITDIVETSALSDNLGQKDKEMLEQLLEKISSIKGVNSTEAADLTQFEDIKNILNNYANKSTDLTSSITDIKDTISENIENSEIEVDNSIKNNDGTLNLQTETSKQSNVKEDKNNSISDASLNNDDIKDEISVKSKDDNETNIVTNKEAKQVNTSDTEEIDNNAKKDTDTELFKTENSIEDDNKYLANRLNSDEKDIIQTEYSFKEEQVAEKEDAENTAVSKTEDNSTDIKASEDTSKNTDSDNLKNGTVLDKNIQDELKNLSDEDINEVAEEKNVILANDANKILNQETKIDNSENRNNQNNKTDNNENYSNNAFYDNNELGYDYNEEQKTDESFKKNNSENSKTKFSENIQINKNEQNLSDESLKVKSADGAEKNINKLEKNLEKAVFTQKMLDKAAVSVNTLNTSSSALTVADEVAKLAIEENGSINSSNLTGNILYDSTGHGFSIKNLSAMKAPESIFSQIQSKLDSNNILNQINEKLTDLKNSASQKLTMILRPNNLGRLSIELLSNKDGLTTSILAQNSDVRAYIEKNIMTLRNQLIDAGINVNNIQIKTAGESGYTSYDRNGGHSMQDGNQDFENQNNFKQQENNQKNQRQSNNELLAGFSNYDYSFTKDFSGILNKTMSYSI